LRDDNRSLTWYEQHYPFAEVINEEVLHAMTAGSGDYAISWKPNFRFPGQYEDGDMGLAATGASFLVQNHYREYMPRFGRYNRVDPVNVFPNGIINSRFIATEIFPLKYGYSSILKIFINKPHGGCSTWAWVLCRQDACTLFYFVKFFHY